MKTATIHLLLISVFLWMTPFAEMYGQSKKIKRPSSRVGIATVDNFVSKSFNIYDKVYRYEGYQKTGKSLEDEDLDVLESAIDDVTSLSASAPAIISSLEGQNVLKQSKATLQINRAQKALKYSLTTAKELLLGQKEQRDAEDENAQTEEEDGNQSGEKEDTSAQGANESMEEDTSSTFKISSKFDFVPGEDILFYDDFSADYIGDFPSKWNTNGGGEIVTINGGSEKWLKFIAGYKTYYIPDLAALPDEYTIEFDLLTSGLDAKTSSVAGISILISDEATFNVGKNYILAWLPFGQYGAFGIKIRNFINQVGGDINNTIAADIRAALLNQPHISMAVNKQRFRLWVNETKYIDIPRLVPKGAVLRSLKFNVDHVRDGVEHVFIRNLKIAAGGQDLRRKLIEEGAVSTNGILFASGSATIQPQSYGIIRQISQVLLQENDMRLTIIGHTDDVGDAAKNLSLSTQRAASVKQALVKMYNIDASRLEIEGKGELIPVGDNTTADGKAQNRRVEFIKH